MKTIPQILEEVGKRKLFDIGERYRKRRDERGGLYPHFWCEDTAVKELKNLVKNALTKILDELPDDQSLEDESNGRYNREMELRACIKKLKGDI